jgi:ParB/RepB/Spo0J family partition protein
MTNETIVDFDLDLFDDSPFQPRKVYDQAELEEMAETIKQPTGRMHQPVVARMVNGRAETIFGHKRRRAARLAGDTTAPTVFREMTDEQVKVAQIVENLQRSGVNAVDEAEAMLRLRDEHNAPIEQLMRDSGKSRSFVYNRLRLATATHQIKQQVRGGQLDPEVAQEIARLPSPLQLKAMDRVHGLSYRNAKAELERSFQFKLTTAPFSLLDAKLFPKAGACVECPKRSDAEPVLLDECGPNVCMDGECYGKKATIHREIEAKKQAKADATKGSTPATGPQLSPQSAWPFPQHPGTPRSQESEVEEDDEPPELETVDERTPEEQAVMNHDRWGEIRKAMMRATLTRPRTTDDLRYLLTRELDLGDSDFGDAEELLGWELPQGSGREARMAKLEEMTADELGALLMMTAVLTGPFSMYSGKSQAQKRIEMAEHFGVDVLTGLQASAQVESPPPSAARAPKKAKAGAGAKKAKGMAAPKDEAKSDEQKDEAGSAGDRDPFTRDLLEEAGA